jgi:Anti-sigma-K factor rskA, C-terminal
MKIDKEKFKELCPLYFLDALDPDELAEFNEALLSGDDEIKSIYNEFKILFLYFPLSADQVEPSPGVKTALFDKIHKLENGKSAQQSFFEKLVLFIGLKNPKLAFTYLSIFILGIIISIYFVYQKNNTIESQKYQIVELKNIVEKDEQILKILGSKEIKVVIMNGLDVNPAGYGKIIFNPLDHTAILQVSNLPKTAEDKDYQLWTIKNNKPLSSGIFSIKDKNEKNYFLITNINAVQINDINAFAITLEPKGGVPQPTGKMYLLGNANL